MGIELRFFRTCQVRVARFDQSRLLPLLLLLLFLLANPLRQVSRQSSSPILFASSRLQCAPLDLTRQCPIAVSAAGTQPQNRMPKYLTDKMSDKMVEHMSAYMSNRMPKYMPKSMPEYMSYRMPKLSVYDPHHGLPWWGSLEVK